MAACGDDGLHTEFTTNGDFLAVVGDNGPEPFYVKGVNLGVGIPGTYPGELALDRETYLRWFSRMREIGVNTVRIYTLHHPAFYEAVFEFNNFRPHDPLYVLHGGWLDEDNPTGGLDLHDLTEPFDTSIEEVIDAVHGNADIEHRLGRGFGHYEVDISRWVIGYIVGREVHPGEVITTNRNHGSETSYQGRYLDIENATPTETWITQRLDHVLSYEAERYGESRPLGFSSWPTLDPINHPTEPHYFDESDDGEEVRAGEDDAQIDITKIDFTRAPAGLFASYHAYPYYPDFVYRDPNYINATDHIGPNNYVGYLRDLKTHYDNMPLLILEYGVPSSWGNAHLSPPTGLSHGGLSEIEQGDGNARLTLNIADADCGGGAMFAWMDEWWKLTWVVAHRTYPIQRFPLWIDVLSPEENFGLIAYDLPPPVYNRWPTGTPEALENGELAGPVTTLDVDVDAKFFHLRLALERPLVAGDNIEIAFDTYADELGETVLPSGRNGTSRAEIALDIRYPDSAQVYVTEAYDLFGFAKGLATDAQKAQSTATDGAPWKPWLWVSAEPAVSDTQEFQYPLILSDEGKLDIRLATEPAGTRDSIRASDSHVDISIPWTLLNFSDPSLRHVVHDDLTTQFRREALVSDGVRVSVFSGDSEFTTQRLRWSTWDTAPATIEREKPAMQAFADALANIPE